MRKIAIRSTRRSARAWLANRSTGDEFEANDPVLNEPCLYATAPVPIGGWTVVARRTKADVMHSANVAVITNVVVGAIGFGLVAR
jgi:hypothetical protein